MAEPLRVGLIGLGSIGLDVVELVQRTAADRIQLVGAVVQDLARSDRPLPTCGTVSELMKFEPEVVVELAGHEGLRQHGEDVLAHDIDLYFLAVGALAEPEFEARFRTAAKRSRGQALIVSGAIGALDAISGAALGGLERVQHTVRKPPATLLGEAEAAGLKEPREIFRGCAREAALAYPESVNVSAAVSMAGVGLDDTQVVIMVDPAVSRNIHIVEAEGVFGSLRFEIQNVPSRSNPKTGSLVAMTVVHQLLKRFSAISVG